MSDVPSSEILHALARIVLRDRGAPPIAVIAAARCVILGDERALRELWDEAFGGLFPTERSPSEVFLDSDRRDAYSA